MTFKRARVWGARFLLSCLGLALLALAATTRMSVSSQMWWGGYHPIIAWFFLQVIGAGAGVMLVIALLIWLIREAVKDA